MTLFEKIIAREIPSKIVFENEEILAIRDIAPRAPTHVLVIPKKAIPRVAEANETDAPLLGKLLLASAKIAKDLGLAGGYRLVINSGRDGGETIPHLHVHLLGGRPLEWPPG